MDFKLIIFIIFVILFISIVGYKSKEFYTGAVITQLQARGPMDNLLSIGGDNVNNNVCGKEPLCWSDIRTKKSQNPMFT